MLIKTTAQKKISQLKKRIRIVQGGTSSSKTFTILPLLINYAIKKPNSEISVVSESIPHLKRGALKDFLKIMDWTNNFNPNSFNKSNLTYKFANGSYIEFFSADQPDKLRGARRDVLFINECNNVSFESYQQLAIRTKKFIYLDYNPTNEFWVHTELIDDPNADFIILTYKDNEGLDPAIVAEIEKAKEKAEISSYWANWWKVYGLGQIGTLEGVIFNNWKTIDVLPNDARLLGYGIDFGYTNDPTAIIEVYKWNDKRILNEICYEKGLTNAQIAKRITTKMPAYCDSAEPKSIAELKLNGVNAFAVEKGTDSIKYGINIIQENEYLVTSQSTNLISELRKYAWDKDKKTGETLNKPIDDFNHCFVGETLITTINGEIPLKDIQVGELVLTSNGYKKVLKKFNNGVKKTYKYSIQFDTFLLSLTCTKEHKIKTQKGWKEISKLQETDVLYLSNFLTQKNIICTKEKDILAEEQKDFIQKFGNIIKGLFLKGIMYTILMVTLPIMIFQTLILLILVYILGLKEKKDLKITLNLQRIFIQKELKKQQNGISLNKEKNGINNTQSNVILEKKHLGKENAINAQKNMRQKKVNKSFVQMLVKHIQEGIMGLMTKKEYAVFVKKNTKQINIQKHKIVAVHVVSERQSEVYDLMIDDTHEYFANSVLVHNCIDSFRYHEMMTLGVLKRPTSIRIRV